METFNPRPSVARTTKGIWLYVLRLTDGKYYVGITSRKNPYMRINQHGGPLGAKWTALHKPKGVEELRDLGEITWEHALKIEQATTLHYAKQYGYNNVRGGRLTYRGKYVRLFDRYLAYPNWQLLRTICFLLFVIAILLSLYELKP